MSQYMKDSGHWWMRTCDDCGGAFACEAPSDSDAESDWACETCTEKDAEIARLREQLGGANAMVDSLRAMEGEERAKNARLRAALKPFADFAKAFDAAPLRGIADEVYGIHMGTQWESSLRLSDCRAALKALEEKP